MSRVRLALAIAFDRPWAYAVAVLGAAGMALLIVWSSGLLASYPTGWELYATPEELATVGMVSVLFGVLVPLQVAALARARSAVGTVGGLAGALAGLLGVSCCAPFLIPALLSFVGFSGTALLGFNAAVRDLAAPLTLASIGLMLVSIGLVSRTITAACALPPRPRSRP